MAPRTSDQGQNEHSMDRDLSPSIELDNELIATSSVTTVAEIYNHAQDVFNEYIIRAPQTSNQEQNVPDDVEQNFFPPMELDNDSVAALRIVTVAEIHKHPEKNASYNFEKSHISKDTVSYKNIDKILEKNLESDNLHLIRSMETFQNHTDTRTELVAVEITPQKNIIAPPLQKKEQLIIPSPFKRVLYWPGVEESKKGKKRKFKEKLPYAVTSVAWRQYHQNKEDKKRIQLEEKEKRAKERQDKRTLKEILKKQSKKNNIIKKRIQTERTSSETEAEIHFAESDDSYELENYEENNEKTVKEKSDSIPNLPLSKLLPSKLKGSYVIVLYEGEYFPGIVENVSKDRYEVSTMSFSTANTFKWPEKKDEIWYDKKYVVEHIDPPVLVNKRGFYSVKEMMKYSSFTF